MAKDEKVRPDFDARIAEAWGDVWKEIEDPALAKIGIPVAYIRPFTLADLGRIRKLADGDHLKTLVYTMIVKLCDDSGDPIFSVKNKVAIENKMPSDDISRIVNKINESGEFLEGKAAT